MSPLSAASRHERARVASLTRSRSDDDPELVDARGNLATERIADHITHLVDQAPALSTAQCDRLVSLLKSGAS